MTASNTFRLFSANSYHCAFAGISPATPGQGLAWNTTTLVGDGTLRVSSLVNTDPVTLTPAVSDGLLTLSWPTDHIGWRLQVQTNPVSVGLGTNWLEVPNSSTTTQITLALDPAVGCGFYRLLYP